MFKYTSVHTSILPLTSFKKDTTSRTLNKEGWYHETVALPERSQSQRTMCCWIPLIRNVQERPMGGNRKQIHGCLRPAGARGWEAMAGRVQAFFLV